MEAPEKIFVTITHPVSDKYTEIIAFEHGKGIEYTRTDVFFKKLEEWLDEYISDLASVDTHILVGSFKNYMEGKL